MRRVIVIAAAGFSLAGCGSLSWDAFKSTPPPMQIQLESTPPGADARTSLGPGCKTPCSVNIPTRRGDAISPSPTLWTSSSRPPSRHTWSARHSPWIGQDRSQSDRRRTSAHRPAAEAGPEENAPAEKPKPPTAPRPRPPRNRRSPNPAPAPAPRSGGRTTAAAARPLIACTAPRLHPTKVPIVPEWQRAYIVVARAVR